MSSDLHNYQAWIIICSLRAQASIISLQTIAARHPQDGDVSPTLHFFKQVDLNASNTADDIARIDHTPQPDDSVLDRSEKLEFWGNRALGAVRGMCDAALRLVGTAEEPDLPAITEMLEEIEETATDLTMAVASPR